MSISKLAGLVSKIISKKISSKIKIIYTKTNDKRSYHINSDKISKELGFNLVDHRLELYGKKIQKK